MSLILWASMKIFSGGSLAKYGSEGVETYVVAATRGERCRYHDGTEDPGPETMGRIREQELLDAPDVLGVEEVSFLDYMDGTMRNSRSCRPNSTKRFGGVSGVLSRIQQCERRT